MTAAGFDLAVVGGTIGGVAAAVRAAREGLDVVIVEASARLGGMLSGGLGVMDTQYDGHRAPIYDEFCARIVDHYATTYGTDSEQYRNCVPREAWPLTAEPHVMELVIRALVAAESRITVVLSTTVVAVERRGRLIASLALSDGTTIRARTFADGTYEADLAALAGAPYRVGRESRAEFGEPHAGRIFTKQALTADGLGAWPQEAATDSLNMRRFKSVSQEIFAGSTGEGDRRVQAYSYRLCLSRDPDNRVLPEAPADYDPELYRRLDSGAGIGAVNLPNGKRFWFRNLPGANWDYPDGDEATRAAIRDRHRTFALGYLYFLQNDESVSDAVRADASGWGLARDEFVDNDNFPYELYVREARRIVGRAVFTEHHASLGPGLGRTPVARDSIAIAEWFMDSHEVSEETRVGSSREGKILLTEITRPSQIPFGALLPQSIDNLLVPVCMSSTHVGWGTLRLEPVWAHVGESAGWAAALARSSGSPVAEVDVEGLQRVLARSGVALGFFNDVDVSDGHPWVAAVEYLSARGFFADYDARPGDALGAATARTWARAALLADDPADVALAVAKIAPDELAVDGARFTDLVEAAATLAGIDDPIIAEWRRSFPAPTAISRGEACRLLFELVASGTTPTQRTTEQERT